MIKKTEANKTKKKRTSSNAKLFAFIQRISKKSCLVQGRIQKQLTKTVEILTEKLKNKRFKYMVN